jgi:hypothetical protein
MTVEEFVNIDKDLQTVQDISDVYNVQVIYFIQVVSTNIEGTKTTSNTNTVLPR